MKNLLLYTIIGGIFWLVSCSDENQILPENHLLIPNDTLAFYLIEGHQEYIDLKNITVDSIKDFGNRIIGYEEIISYDTSKYIFELTSTGIENFDSLYFARYARHFPIAVISEGEFLFGVYISHGACSSIADWFRLDYYYEQPFPNNYLYFSLPPLIDETFEPNLRLDSKMLHVLERDNKLI